MRASGPRYGKEEFARRGDEIYDRLIRPGAQKEDDGKFVAIDIESEQFEIDVDEMTACDRLEARIPEPQIWLTRIGLGYVRRYGYRRQIR